MEINKITMQKPFEDLFPVENDILNAVKKNMELNGFDNRFPILIWKGKNIVIDGHTRLMAARSLGIDDIPVHNCDFNTEYEALLYALHIQCDRRNITDADLYRGVELVDAREPKGGNNPNGCNQHTKVKGSTGPSTKRKTSAEKTAEVLGTSSAKVKKIRTIKDYADEKIKKQVQAGKISINKAYNKTQEKRKREKQEAGRDSGEEKILSKSELNIEPKESAINEEKKTMIHIEKMIDKLSMIDQLRLISKYDPRQLTIKLIAQELRVHNNQMRIAMKLNEHGIKTLTGRGEWFPSTIRNLILKNEYPLLQEAVKEYELKSCSKAA